VALTSGYPVRSFKYGPADLLADPAFKLESSTDTAEFDVLVGNVRGFIVNSPGVAAVTPINPIGNALPPTVYMGPDIAKANLINAQNVSDGAQQVTLRVSIDKDGRVTNPTVMSGNPRLINAAIEAVQQWRYRPHLVNGQPSPVVTTVTVNFP
jgi:TonB family protein